MTIRHGSSIGSDRDVVSSISCKSTRRAALLNSDFTCNNCDAQSTFNPDGDWREAPSCANCGSSVRTRQLIYCLTSALYGSPATLSSIKDPKYSGVGLSDPELLANQMASAFIYTNTFYHSEPKLDICNPSESRLGRSDFLISSDVFEHVPSPVQAAFDGAFAVLRPGGILVLTVPFDERVETTERFPNVKEFKLMNFDGEWLLVGKTQAQSYEVHDNLIFHGGPGTTVEMRFFSRQAVISHLLAAGFTDVVVHGQAHPEYGIFPPHEQGLPITARKPA